MTNAELIDKFNYLESKFKRACEQVTLLANNLVDCRVRRDMAKRHNKFAAEYALKMEIATLHSLYRYYYIYTVEFGNAIDSFEDQLTEGAVMENPTDWDSETL